MKNKKVKQTLIHRFQYNGREQKIYSFPKLNPDIVFLETGIFTVIDYTNPQQFISANRRVLKNLKTFMFHEMNEKGLDATNVIIDLKVPETVRNSVKESFVGLTIMWPNNHGVELVRHQPFSEQILEYFYEQLLKFNPENIAA